MIIYLLSTYARLALLGYAGMPALESLPCFAISIFTLFRVYNIYMSRRRTGPSQAYSPTTSESRPASSSSHIYHSFLDLDLEAPTLTPPSPVIVSPHSSVFAQVGHAPPTPEFCPAMLPLSPGPQYIFSSTSLPQSPQLYNLQSRSPGWGPRSSQTGSLSPWSGTESFEMQQKSYMDGMDSISVLDAYDSTAALTQHWPGVGEGVFAFVPHTKAVQEEWSTEAEEKETKDKEVVINQEPMAINWGGKYNCEGTMMSILLIEIDITQSSRIPKRRQEPKQASCLSYGDSSYFSCAY